MEDVCTVLVADDQVLYREGLCELMGHWSEFRVVGDVANGAEAVEFCRTQVPDLILMDVQMPVMDGIEATGVIMETCPHVKVVMLTVSADEEHLFGAIRNGAIGYILKDMPARQLHNRLRGVIRGEGVLSGAVASKAIRRLSTAEPVHASSGPGAQDDPDLNERERQVLKLVAQGLSNEEIGARLFLSPATVKKQLSSLMQRLYLENRVQLAVYAVHHGLD